MCSYARVPAGAARTVTLSATTSSTQCSSISNSATVTAGNDSNSTNNAAGPVTINVSCPPQLKVEKLPKNGTFTSGSQVSFTIKVTNAGSGTAANVKLTDQLPGNGGLVWQIAMPQQGSCVNPISGNALNCSLGNIPAGGSVTVMVLSTGTTPAAACQLQSNPVALATADGGITAQDSGSTNCTPPSPRVAFLKYTNGANADDPNGAGVPLVAPGGTVTWMYRVQNTGNTSVPRAQVVVTDDSGPVPVFARELVGNGDGNLDPWEIWDYEATGIALDLSLAPPAGVHTVAMSCTANGTQPPRTAYVNMGKVTIPGATSSDPSSYCNPPRPGVAIVKYTNGADANDPNGTDVPRIASGAAVTWTYKVTNTGNTSIPRAQVLVTDNTTGVTPTFGSEVSGNGDTSFDPGEVWLYTATGLALDLAQPAPSGVTTVANACTAQGAEQPRTAYRNVGTVTIPGATANDPSTYCNPPPPPCPPESNSVITTVLPNGDVQITLNQSLTNSNDNSYGANSVGWLSKAHTFSSLVGSDKAEFILKDKNGNVVLDFFMDYISQKTGAAGGYATLGPDGGDGSMVSGNRAYLKSFTTSLTENLKQFCTGTNCTVAGVNLLVDSPPTICTDNTTACYALPAGSPFAAWSFTNSYTVVIAKEAFGAAGYGSVTIGTAHNSPGKGTAPFCIPGQTDGGTSACALTSTGLSFDKTKVTFTVTNNGSVNAVLSSVLLNWPASNGKLRKISFDGDVVYDTPDVSAPSANLSLADLVSDVNKRTIAKGTSDKVTIEFEHNVDTTAASYTGTFGFGTDCSITLD